MDDFTSSGSVADIVHELQRTLTLAVELADRLGADRLVNELGTMKIRLGGGGQAGNRRCDGAL